MPNNQKLWIIRFLIIQNAQFLTIIKNAQIWILTHIKQADTCSKITQISKYSSSRMEKTRYLEYIFSCVFQIHTTSISAAVCWTPCWATLCWGTSFSIMNNWSIVLCSSVAVWTMENEQLADCVFALQLLLFCG